MKRERTKEKGVDWENIFVLDYDADFFTSKVKEALLTS